MFKQEYIILLNFKGTVRRIKFALDKMLLRFAFSVLVKIAVQPYSNIADNNVKFKIFTTKNLNKRLDCGSGSLKRNQSECCILRKAPF